MQNIYQLLERAAEKFPDRKAIAFQDTITSYKELHSITLDLSAGLERLGIKQNTKIAFILPNVPEFIYAFLAVARCGGVTVPLNPAYKKSELEHILKDSDTEFIITASKTLKTLLPLEVSRAIKKFILTDRENVPDDARIVFFEELLKNAQANEKNFDGVDPDNTACIIYTNAQSGYLLGAELTHKNLVFDAQKCVDATKSTEKGVFLGALPFFHGFGVTTGILFPMTAGSAMVPVEKFSPEKVLATIEKEKVSFFSAVPAMFGILCVYAGRGADLSSLPYGISGGAALTKEIKERFESAFNIPIIEGYGLTECSPVVSFNPPPPDGINKFGSIGPAFPGVSAKVVDEKGIELPAGVVGELCIAGKLVMKGYYKNPEETAKYLKDGWLHTGDFAKIDTDGYIFITGVKKRMVLVGGLNVYCAEVERILKSYPGVTDAKLFAVEDELFGQLPNAEVTVNKSVTERELIDFCKGNIASYKVPRKINVIMR